MRKVKLTYARRPQSWPISNACIARCRRKFALQILIRKKRACRKCTAGSHCCKRCMSEISSLEVALAQTVLQLEQSSIPYTFRDASIG